VFNYIATPEESTKYLKELWDLVSQGKLNVKIHKEYPFTLEGVQSTHRDIVGRSTVGKLILKIA